MYLYNNIVHYDFLLLYEMKQGLTLRSRCACFSEFPLLFSPSVRKEQPDPVSTYPLNCAQCFVTDYDRKVDFGTERSS